MKRQWLSSQRLRCMAGVATCLFLETGQAISQNDGSHARDGQGESVKTSDGVLSITASIPSQVRTDERFEYQVTVTNTSDQMVLHDIKLKHQSDQGITIESVKLDGKSNNQNRQANRNREQQGQQQNQQQSQQNQQQNLQQVQLQQNQLARADANQTLTIDKLEPGESKTLQVTGSAEEEGQANACLMVMSYRPAICLQTKVVQPELKITKAAPDRVNQCEVIELVYTVTNDGSGSVGKFEIVDELADGIKTIDGRNRLAFEVDQLKSGDTRRFVARVFATKTGEFKSRAMAQARDSDLKSRSKNVGPNVVGADLQVRVDSNGAVYSRRPAMFTAMVTNHGNAPAENVQVDVHWPEEARLIRISNLEMTMQNRYDNASNSRNAQNANLQSDANQSPARQTRDNTQASDDSLSQNRDNRSVSEQATDNDENRLNTNAKNRQANQQRENRRANQQRSQQKNQQARNQQLASGEPQRQITIDRLEPGQTAKFTYTLSAREADEIPTRVEAVYTCTVDEAHDSADAETRKTSQAMASVQVIRLPALQIYAVDDVDPVPPNKNVTYLIRVKNEGDASDENVKITAKIPDELKFVSADGPTEFEQDDNEVTFQPIESLPAGDEVEYTLTAQAMKDGNVKLKVELESDALSSTVQSEEPTQLFNAQASN